MSREHYCSAKAHQRVIGKVRITKDDEQLLAPVAQMVRRVLLLLTVAPHCRTKIQGAGLDPHPGGWRLVGLGVGMGGFRDQGVETGRFRSM